MSPCLCGDTQCPSCGFAQGTLETVACKKCGQEDGRHTCVQVQRARCTTASHTARPSSWTCPHCGFQAGARRIYMASSWRNARLDAVATALRQAGHEVYDFRTANPPANFNWAMVSPGADWANPVLSAKEQQEALRHPIAQTAFGNDRDGLQWADTGVLVLPCGKSAHLEAGYLLAQGKTVHVLLADDERPELMHLVAGPGNIHATLEEVVAALGTVVLA